MKATSILYTCLLTLILVIAICAQEKQVQNADLIREQVSKLEIMDSDSQSSSVRMIHKRTLLSLYDQLKSALRRDITDLKSIQEASTGADSEIQRDILVQIQKLTSEEEVVSLKLSGLKSDLQTTASASLPSNAQRGESPSLNTSTGVGSKPISNNANSILARGEPVDSATTQPAGVEVRITPPNVAGMPLNSSQLRAFVPPSPAPQQGPTLREDLNSRVNEVARANIEQRSPSKQAETPNIHRNSTAIVDSSASGDLVNFAANLAGLTGISNDNTPTPGNSVAFTVSAYTLLAGLNRTDPLNPGFYNRNQGWRRLSFTLGYDDAEPVTGTTLTEQARVFGVKYLIIDKREPGRERHRTNLNRVTNALYEATNRFGDLFSKLSAHVFTNKKVREKIVLPQFRTFLTGRPVGNAATAASAEAAALAAETAAKERPNGAALQKDAEDKRQKAMEAAEALSVAISLAKINNGTAFSLNADGLLPERGQPNSWTNEELEFSTIFANTYLVADYRNKLKTEAGQDVLDDLDKFIEKELENADAFKNLSDETQNAIEAIRKAPQFSFYVLSKQRKLGADDYRGEAIFDFGIANRINLTLNGSFDYRDSQVIGGDSRGGRFAGELQFQLSDDDLSGRKPLYFFLGGEGKGRTGVKPTYSAQAKLSLPIANGIDFPLSLTYSNRAELNDENTIRGQFGFTFDTARLIKAFTQR